MDHKVQFTRQSADELKLLDKDVVAKLFVNFIQPIRNGLTPPGELQGKYKPSWEMPFIKTPFQQAYVDHATKHNLHHYHFGYKIYSPGRDAKYPGDESAGIVHTRIENGQEATSHVILETCLDHPSPFKYPFARATEPAVIDA